MIHLLDSWERKYIENLKDRDLLAWDDFEAWQRYPKHSWIYDKQALAVFTGLLTYDLEKEIPDKGHYPYIVKPRTNFSGLSKDAYVVSSEDEIEDWEGMIAQEFLEGHHGTADVVMLGGVVLDSFAFTTHKNYYGEIKLFESNPFLPLPVADKLRMLFSDYTGVVNVEYIAGRIIEIHLRPSLQFYDICNGFIEQIPSFINNKKWNKVKYKRTYSKIYRTKYEGVPEVKAIPVKSEGISSVQLCWENGKTLSETDPSLGKNRYMVVNGTDLQAIENFGKQCQIVIK
jgi:hypothetical protein